jgi:hypothetical protein
VISFDLSARFQATVFLRLQCGLLMRHSLRGLQEVAALSRVKRFRRAVMLRPTSHRGWLVLQSYSLSPSSSFAGAARLKCGMRQRAAHERRSAQHDSH